MKRISNLILSLSALASAAFSCDLPNEMDPLDWTDPADMRIVATIDGLGSGYQLQWQNGDRIGIYVTAQVEPTNNLGTILRTDDGQYFTGTANPFEAGDLMYSYFPFVTGSHRASAVPMSIPAEQTQSDCTIGGYDVSNNPMVGTIHTFATDSDGEGVGNVNITMKPLGGVIRFAVYGDYTTEKIQSVTFSSSTPLTGSVNYDISAAEPAGLGTPNGTSEVMTRINGDVSVPAAQKDAASVFMTVFPGTYSGTVILRTDAGVYSFDVQNVAVSQGEVTDYALQLTEDSRQELKGTADNPYTISNIEDLKAMRTQVVSNSPEEIYFVLQNDIDLEGANWTPLDSEGKYPINFDGQNHTISNFTASGEGASFFGHLWGTVKNLKFENATIQAQGYRAGVAAATVGLSGRGNDHEGHLENVHALSGTVSQSTNTALVGWTGQAGGLVGELAYTGSTMRNCSANVEVTGDFVVGGLLGQANSATIVEGCYATGNVSGGAMLPATPEADQANGLLDPTSYNSFGVKLSGAGGLIGSVSRTTVTDCYATGDVTNTDQDRGVAGGLVGVTLWSATIENCYAAGNVTATLNGGGILGASAFYVRSDCMVRNCIAWNDMVASFGPDINSARVAGYYWITDGAALINNYAKSTMVVDIASEAEYADSREDTSNNQDDMDGSTRTIGQSGVASPDGDTTPESVFNHGHDTDDICATAQEIGWSSDVWDFSGELPKLKWEN